MAGKFELRKFSDIDLSDPFFDELKQDYPGTEASTGFIKWFTEKSAEGRTALVFDDEQGLGAFVCLKTENEPIELVDSTLPQKLRTKVSTLRIAERYRGQRLGEGAIGLILWKWQAMCHEELYLTVFPSHQDLILQLDKFGFINVGMNKNDERVYIRSRINVDYSDPYKAFPFVNPSFEKAGYLIIDDNYHDTLFPYSELKNNTGTKVVLDVSNGLSKVYIGTLYNIPHYKIGEPIFVYRKFNGVGTKRYKSCLTTYCVVKNVSVINRNGQHLKTFDEYKRCIGNKSVFTDTELHTKYYNDVKSLVVIELVYYGYFGEGNNVNMDWLDKNGCWGSGYPTETRLSQEQFKKILKEGKIDVPNVIID